MRLVDLRDMVANIVDYDPSVEAYSNQITDLLNDAYYRLFSEKPFTFAQKEEIVVAYSDVSLTVTTVVGPTSELTLAVAVTPKPSHWEGQIIEIDGTEYTIAWVENTTTIFLTEVPSLAAVTAYTAEIKFRYLDMPQDCVALMNVAKRSMTLTPQEPGMFTALARYEDEYYNLPLDEVNLPHYWIPADEFHVTTPRSVGAIAGAGAPTTATAVGIAMSYVFAGRESALSTATSATLSTINFTVAFDLLPDTSGYYRKIYIRNTTSGYKGYRAIPSDPLGTPTYLIDPQANTATYALPDFDSAFEFGSKPYTASDGTTQRIRLYPRQDKDYNITVRYMYRPNPMVDDNDTPEFPSASHQILGYMALKEIFVKLDNLPQANLYERKAAQEMIRLEQRYLTQIPRRFIKRGMVDGRLATLPLYTPLTHT